MPSTASCSGCWKSYRIDAPFGARAVVRVAVDAVHGRVAHEHVGRGHVDLRAQHARALLELAVLHALEQIEVLLDAAVAPGAVHAGLGQRAAVLAHLLGRLVVDIGQSAAYHILCDLIQAGEEVRGEVQLGPLIAQPLDVPFDAFDERSVFLGGVRVVEAQITHAAVFLRRAEVDAHRLAVAYVQEAVGLRREARAHVVEAAARQILVDDLLDEVCGLALGCLHEMTSFDRCRSPRGRGAFPL